MAAHKKLIKRDRFIIFRVTRKEKNFLEEEAMEHGRDFSQHIRIKLGLSDKNE